MTPANEQERAPVAEPAQAVQDVTDQNVDIAFVWVMVQQAAPLLKPGS